MPNTGNGLVDLVARKLPALTRFCPLGDLDLKLVAVHQIVRRDAETCAGHLLDRAAFAVAVRQRNEARLVLASLSAIRSTPDAIHRNGEILVGFLADTPEAHRPGGE